MCVIFYYDCSRSLQSRHFASVLKGDKVVPRTAADGQLRKNHGGGPGPRPKTDDRYSSEHRTSFGCRKYFTMYAKKPDTAKVNTIQSKSTTHTPFPSKQATNSPTNQLTSLTVLRYVLETRISALHKGHRKLGVKRTSSSRTFLWHSGHRVRSEYELNSMIP